jgi:hypothetical protein
MDGVFQQTKLGVISTSRKDGKVDSAVIGSPQMVDEKTVMVALAGGRTFTNPDDLTGSKTRFRLDSLDPIGIHDPDNHRTVGR